MYEKFINSKTYNTKKDAFVQFSGESQNLKLPDNQKKLQNLKANIKDKIGQKLVKLKIQNQRRALNNNVNKLFSNDEIIKYINKNIDKITETEGNDYFSKNKENKLITIITNNRDGLYETYEKLIENNKNQIYPKYKHSIEVKEESTNTCFNENNNYPEIDNLKLNSFELNKNNTQEGKIFQLKTTVHKNNNFIDFNDNHDNIFNKTQNKEFKKKSNNIINISINNNINFNSETNKNKYYLDLFNFRLIQSFIQNRSNYFKLKNKNIFGLYPTHYQTPDNFSFLLNAKIGIDNMKFSLREIYRNLNNNKPTFNIFQLNQKKKKKIQKKSKNKTYDKKYEETNNINDKKSLYKLMNVQYDLDNYYKSKTKDKNKNKIFLESIFPERDSKDINNKKKDENGNEFQNSKYLKTSTNFSRNIFKQKFKYFKDDILEKGLTNSNSRIKSIKKTHSNKINKQNYNFPK